MLGHLSSRVLLQAITLYWLCHSSCFPNTMYFIAVAGNRLPLPPTPLLVLQQGSVQDLVWQGGEEGAASSSARGCAAVSCQFLKIKGTGIN